MVPLRQSLAFRVLGLSFILLALPLFVDSFILMKERYKELFSQAERYLVEINKEREVPLSQDVRTKRALIPFLTYFFDLNKNFPAQPNEKLNQNLREIADKVKQDNIPLLITLSHIDGNGFFSTVASSSYFLPKEQVLLLPIYRYFSAKNFQSPVYSTIVYSAATSQYLFISSYLIPSEEEKKPVGIITVTYFLKGNIEQLLAPDKDPYIVRFALLLPDKIVVAASDPSLIHHTFANVEDSELQFLPEETREKMILPPLPMLMDKNSPLFRFPWDKNTQIGVMRTIGDTPFLFLSYSAEGDIYSMPLKDLSRTYWLYAFVLLMGGLGAFLITKWLSMPYRQLVTVMDGISHGDMSLRYQTERQGFEINQLGRTFNSMIESMVEKERKAEEEKVKREVYSHELKLGREVQRGLLPEKMPFYEGVVLVEHYLPAKEVGGDFYDILIREKAGKRELILVIADAAGKGVQACFYSLGVRSYFRTLAMEFDDPATIMKEANRLFCRDTLDSGMFVTAVMAIFDGETRTLRYFSCGHNPPLLRRANGEVIKFQKQGMAMGFKEKIEGETQSIVLETGDALLLYTDGITEEQDEKGNLFSEEKLIKLFKESGGPIQEFTTSLLEEVKLFSGKTPQFDDITLLGMKII